LASRPRLSLVKDTWLLSREGLVLFGLGLLTVALFFVTSTVVARHHAAWAETGREWFARGEAALAEGRPDAALEALRTALVYDRDNSRYHFRLAQSLLASGRTAEARSYLRGLSERQPGSGPVELELARLAARSGDTDRAASRYRAAIQGYWEEEDPEERRLQLRLELAEMLVERGSAADALSELVAAAARLPDDGAIRARVGDLFRRAGDDRRALEEYRVALRASPGFPPALLGAGRAAFALRDWRAAATLLRRAVRALPGEPVAAELLQSAEAAAGADPFLEHLGTADQARRAARAIDLSRARLESCLADKPAPELEALRSRLEGLAPEATARALRRRPDGLEPAMELVFAIARQTAARCGPPEGDDRTLLLLAGASEAES